jgi:hypothetical protein
MFMSSLYLCLSSFYLCLFPFYLCLCLHFIYVCLHFIYVCLHFIYVYVFILFMFMFSFYLCLCPHFIYVYVFILFYFLSISPLVHLCYCRSHIPVYLSLSLCYSFQLPLFLLAFLSVPLYASFFLRLFSLHCSFSFYRTYFWSSLFI